MAASLDVERRAGVDGERAGATDGVAAAQIVGEGHSRDAAGAVNIDGDRRGAVGVGEGDADAVGGTAVIPVAARGPNAVASRDPQTRSTDAAGEGKVKAE